MNNKIEQLIDLVRKLPEDYLDKTIEYIGELVSEGKSEKPVPLCPHCRSTIYPGSI